MTPSTTLAAPLRLLVRLPLWQQILIGLTLGIATGLGFGEGAQTLAPLGTLFLNAIKMLIVPLVFVSLVAGITSMHDSAKLGRISLKTIAIYLVTTAFAVSIGLLFGALFSPGEGMQLVEGTRHGISRYAQQGGEVPAGRQPAAAAQAPVEDAFAQRLVELTRQPLARIEADTGQIDRQWG
jgi:L-cystine uptake protein TcyP (sodium:dicarboxylate symporter family)